MNKAIMKIEAQQKLVKSTSKEVRSLFNHFKKKNPVDLDKPKKIEERLEQYMNYVDAHDLIPSYEGLAIALGTSVGYINAIGNLGLKGREVQEVLSKYMSIVSLVDFELARTANMPASVYELRASHFNNINKKSQLDVIGRVEERSVTQAEILELIESDDMLTAEVDAEPID